MVPPDEDDFAALMEATGVRKLGSAPRRAPMPSPRAPEPPPPAPAPPPPTPDPKLEAELAAARTEVAETQQALRAREAELEAARAEVDRLTGEVAELDKERRALSRKLTAQQPAPAPVEATLSLGAAVEARGLQPGELDLCLLGWADAGRGGDLAALLRAQQPKGLTRWLDDRVDLLCGSERCPGRPGTVRIDVAPERCDVCGGSDIKRAAHGFFDACVAAGVKRVRIVGGSPPYRKQLASLTSEDGRVDLKLISGTGRRTKTDARADQKHSDLVVLWGATILDHSVSQNYETGRGRVIPVAHRGIARMLELVADKLSRR